MKNVSASRNVFRDRSSSPRRSGTHRLSPTVRTLAQQLAARNGRRPTAYELRRQPPASGVATRRPRSPSAAASTCRRRLTWCGTSGTTRSGRGGLGRRAQVLDGAGEGSGERSRIGVGLRGPHADPQARVPTRFVRKYTLSAKASALDPDVLLDRPRRRRRPWQGASRTVTI